MADEVRYRERVAVVTGAGTGIGAAIVTQLTANNIKVAGCARSMDKLMLLRDSLGVRACYFTPFCCDLTDPQQVDDFFEHVLSQLGSISILVNNAGMAYSSSVLSGTVTEWKDMMMLNVVALCQCTQLAVRCMQRCNITDGYIINISSEAGHIHPVSRKFHFYSATKHAVRALTETLRTEMKTTMPEARISSISPGLVETQFLAKMAGTAEAKLSVFSKMKALESRDVAITVLQLLQNPLHVQVHDILMRPTAQTH